MLLTRLLQIVAALLVLRIVLRGFAAFVRALRSPDAPAPKRDPAGSTDLIRDRVCNTFVPRERAVRALVSGREEHFCSTDCRDKALLLAKAS